MIIIMGETLTEIIKIEVETITDINKMDKIKDIIIEKINKTINNNLTLIKIFKKTKPNVFLFLYSVKD